VDIECPDPQTLSREGAWTDISGESRPRFWTGRKFGQKSPDDQSDSNRDSREQSENFRPVQPPVGNMGRMNVKLPLNGRPSEK